MLFGFSSAAIQNDKTIRAPYVNYASLDVHIFSIEAIGELEKEKPSDEKYLPGQLFLHRHFGYRGVIVSSWKGKLFDRDLLKSNSSQNINPDNPKTSDLSDITLYQVLTDDKDLNLCNSALKSGITFLPDSKDVISTIYIVSGMDYAFHDDIIPYQTSNLTPIRNDYLSDFFVHDGDRRLSPTDNLVKWVEARKQNLEITSVHRETTESIRTTSIPFFMGRRNFDNKSNEMWRYLIRLENLSYESMQLRERFWKVFSVSGSLESVKGKGVVGTQPLLSPAHPIFQYHSHVQVQVPWAHMWGSFRFEQLQSNGSVDVKIPAFPLCDRAYWQQDRGGTGGGSNSNTSNHSGSQINSNDNCASFDSSPTKN